MLVSHVEEHLEVGHVNKQNCPLEGVDRSHFLVGYQVFEEGEDHGGTGEVVEEQRKLQGFCGMEVGADVYLGHPASCNSLDHASQETKLNYLPNQMAPKSQCISLMEQNFLDACQETLSD